MYNKPLLASKQTFARIDFLRQGGRLVDKKGTFYVKFLLKTRQKWSRRIHVFGQWHRKHVCLHPKQILGLLLNDCARPPKTRALTTDSASGCGACFPWPTGTVSCKREVILTLALCDLE